MYLLFCFYQRQYPKNNYHFSAFIPKLQFAPQPGARKPQLQFTGEYHQGPISLSRDERSFCVAGWEGTSYGTGAVMRSSWSKRGATQNCAVCVSSLSPHLSAFTQSWAAAMGNRSGQASPSTCARQQNAGCEVHRQWIWLFPPGGIKRQWQQQKPWHGGHRLPAPSPSPRALFAHFVGESGRWTFLCCPVIPLSADEPSRCKERILCFRYKAQSAAVTIITRASKVAQPGRLQDWGDIEKARHQCRSGAGKQKPTGSLLLQVQEKQMQPFLGKDPEDKELNAVLLLPSFPKWGALALSDSLRFPVSETSSFWPGSPCRSQWLMLNQPRYSLQTAWGKIHPTAHVLFLCFSDPLC